MKKYYGSLALALLMTLSMAEAKSIKRYSVKSGAIEYKLSGGGSFMGISLKTEATKNLYFRNYGAEYIEEEHKVDTKMGTTTKTHTLTKMDNVTLYSVDFKRKKITKTIDPVGSQYLKKGKSMSADSEKQLKKFGGKKIGIDKVLGYSCEVWKIMGATQCLYKGQIPLRLKVSVMGIETTVIAVKAEFNIAISDEKFKLPKFPVIGSPMYAPTNKTTSSSENDVGNMLAMAKAKLQANPNMSMEEKMKLMKNSINNSKMGKSRLQKAKEQSPKMLRIMKFSRKCLSKADTKADAKNCDKKIQDLSKKMGLGDMLADDEDFEWNKKEKKSILSDLDKQIKSVEKSLPCIQKANSMTDMMKCNKER